jgi:hypothetical protein
VPVPEKLRTGLRAIVTDQNRAQIQAVSGVFPNALMVFCRVLVIRNVDQNFGSKHGATTALRQFHADLVCEGHLFQELEIYWVTFSQKQTATIF